MRHVDLFGQALLDFYKGRTCKAKIERDDGYVDEEDLSKYFAEYEIFPNAEKKALKQAKGRVLDIGVGAGRVALYLQSLGHEVVGIDVSDAVLEVSELRGVRKLVRMSACDLQFPKNSFDTAIAFCNNFGLCGSMEGVQGMLERLHSIIRKDGILLASSVQPTRTRQKAHLRYHKINLDRGRPPGQVTLRQLYGGRKGEWWDLLMVTLAEMRQLCEKTGWRTEKTYRGDMDVHVLRKV
jgi:SAM-dependent methyltransferase